MKSGTPASPALCYGWGVLRLLAHLALVVTLPAFVIVVVLATFAVVPVFIIVVIILASLTFRGARGAHGGVIDPATVDGGLLLAVRHGHIDHAGDAAFGI